MQKKIIIVITLIFYISAFSQNTDQKESQMKITFDDSAAKYVLKNLENAITKERDSIWNTFEGYRITKVWHEKSSYPLTWNIWDRGTSEFLADTTLIKKTLQLANNLTIKVKKEHNSIEQHLSSYLRTKNPMEAFVYYVAFTIPYAFCVENNKIGIDITGHEWNFDTDCLLNTTIHELYHVGFRLNSADYKYIYNDPVDKETYLHFCYAYLQSEGMATYVSYKALDLFPSEYRHEDFDYLEDDSRVRQAFSQMGVLIDHANTLEIDSLLKEAWDIGVTNRAFYIAGAYMAKRIEEVYGKEFLSELIIRGSMEFAREYNAIVEDDYKIALVNF